MRPAHTSGAETPHLPALDGVRGLAILAVLAIHLLSSNNLASSPLLQILLDIRDQLWIGVTLFFSLSGFLITGILYDTLDTENYFKAFYARRALRIFPLYYGVLLSLLLLTPVLHLHWEGDFWRYLTYTNSFPFVREVDVSPAPYLALRHFWSLAVEEQFYLIWPLIVLWLRDWSKILIAALAGSGLALLFRIFLLLRGFGPQEHALPFCMDALLLGAALALLFRSKYRGITLRWAPLVAGIAAAVTLWQAIRNPNLSWGTSPFLATAGMSIIAIGTTSFVAAALAPGSRTEGFCRFRLLRFFGKYSYGIYVYHYSFDAALTNRLRRWLEIRGMSRPEAILFGALLVAAVSVAVAVLSYQLYEKRFLAAKRYFPYRRKIVTSELAHQ